ncbi:DDE-type integrase/transposase/recombinase [Dehalobacterium formicoaceticum]|uniref:DDE-type integrase/transposase/recombinase n=1 Tax=Dehalobacterium formicoaceticum TaxID=51515 RepID=UPI000B801820|nr:DDE-type integrase/transposase/recombinase [Dehalobacterium formicoaceticum]
MPNQVWAIDITYIKMGKSHMYLTAIIDWYSRYIVGWELSDSLDTAPVLEAVKKAISQYGIPVIINSDQGSQFTSTEYTSYLKVMFRITGHDGDVQVLNIQAILRDKKYVKAWMARPVGLIM